MKCIIAGGRDFNEIERLYRIMNKCPHEITEVVCGGAKGADFLGSSWAVDRNIPVKYFLPDWEGLGKRAGFVRNADMGDYADMLVAFWDGKSSGTKNMIDYATNKGLVVKVFNY